jgi:Tol biopolymer transport system component
MMDLFHIYKRSMNMIRRFIPIILVSFAFCSLPVTSKTADENSGGQIRRLTRSGNATAKYPCLSSDGQKMLYTLEIKENDEETKAIKFMNLEDGTETELFRDGTQPGPSPYEGSFVQVGSKPPVLSGNGKTAAFTLSVDGSLNLKDHFLAVMPTDGSGIWITSFPIQSLEGVDLKSSEFESGDWERVASYSISADGTRIVCLMKGHLGPRRLGSASGIILLDVAAKKQTTLLAPEFKTEGWIWTSFPRQPSTGGGWAFCMSEDGRTLVFGAQTSDDPNDYDLYTAQWTSREIRRLTDFSDRWFSLADITQDGQAIFFFYTGQKQQGIGTYRINRDGTGLTYLKSRITPRVDFCDVSGDGRFVLYKNIYQGKRLDLRTGEEIVAFSDKMRGYVQGSLPMDLPQFPSFWRPQIINVSGNRILLIGPPQGKDSPEIYLLTIDTD